MRLDKKLSHKAYEILKEGRRVSNLGFHQSDVENVFATINAINALPEDKSMLNGEPISEYEIPNIFSALIQPKSIKFSSDEFAKDFKDISAYTETSGQTGQVLSPLVFKRKLLLIVKSFKGAEECSPVKAYRVDKALSEIGKRGVVKDDTFAVDDNSNYIPYVLTFKGYEDSAYTVDISNMFAKWLMDIVF